MYRRSISILVFIITLLTCISSTTVFSETTLVETRRFVENLVWETEVAKNIERFRKHEGQYLQLLKSEDPKDVYVAAVMLGLLKAKSTVNSLQSTRANTTQSAIGIAFALCKLNIDYENNYRFLEQVGTKTELAGGARSLANIDAAILMSFLGDERFPSYVSSLRGKTEEVWQHEAIDAALFRYKNMAK